MAIWRSSSCRAWLSGVLVLVAWTAGTLAQPQKIPQVAVHDGDRSRADAVKSQKLPHTVPDRRRGGPHSNPTECRLYRTSAIPRRAGWEERSLYRVFANEAGW